MEVASIVIAAVDCSSGAEGAAAVIAFDFLALGFLGLLGLAPSFFSWVLGCFLFLEVSGFPSLPTAPFPFPGLAGAGGGWS
jgi:hypothetical protein